MGPHTQFTPQSQAQPQPLYYHPAPAAPAPASAPNIVVNATAANTVPAAQPAPGGVVGFFGPGARFGFKGGDCRRCRVRSLPSDQVAAGEREEARVAAGVREPGLLELLGHHLLHPLLPPRHPPRPPLPLLLPRLLVHQLRPPLISKLSPSFSPGFHSPESLIWV